MHFRILLIAFALFVYVYVALAKFHFIRIIENPITSVEFFIGHLREW